MRLALRSLALPRGSSPNPSPWSGVYVLASTVGCGATAFPCNTRKSSYLAPRALPLAPLKASREGRYGGRVAFEEQNGRQGRSVIAGLSATVGYEGKGVGCEASFAAESKDVDTLSTRTRCFRPLGGACIASPIAMHGGCCPCLWACHLAAVLRRMMDERMRPLYPRYPTVYSSHVVPTVPYSAHSPAHHGWPAGSSGTQAQCDAMAQYGTPPSLSLVPDSQCPS
ncbi:hypothetical protein IAQ61_010269 [Plenodomus lingam]|uniref:uncharacterized protein n=1 Tax=Leptosphaeria maculans TaxID=5022 RepID=UPI00331E6A41|nr:hypothetical protein IAQ61_010269 [Plenodomus lingam]